MKYTIAIDGPAASGKSSAAEIIAKSLNFYRLDSGLLYRAITYVLSSISSTFDMADPRTIQKVNALELELRGNQVIYEDKDITMYLRKPNIDRLIGKVAKELYVRQKVHELQRCFIESTGLGIVIDGRDIGTVVLPNAFLKIFLTAKDTTRAKRRIEEFPGEYEEVLEDIRKRDNIDITREHGPLKCADDAILIENDEMNLNETVDRILTLFNEKKNRVEKSKDE